MLQNCNARTQGRHVCRLQKPNQTHEPTSKWKQTNKLKPYRNPFATSAPNLQYERKYGASTQRKEGITYIYYLPLATPFPFPYASWTLIREATQQSIRRSSAPLSSSHPTISLSHADSRRGNHVMVLPHHSHTSEIPAAVQEGRKRGGVV